jgi:hypothetical protein
MDCDPQVWSLVEREIRGQIQDMLSLQQTPTTFIHNASGSSDF